uniref:baculoviral IAP repeat-containing protein 3-like isoform X1 n=1 Tax=Ciona intestinalis TaxID=7719 RepID=UPI00089DCA23|nr:baculoviral IAP repeat-containing protein 3-like isoform X1 [Ciona intestinalis]|eukprot:XP_018671694.1 baculoviral IAP repeat-containing protein 3-like isoform X1 [Ciona intestinalis]
MFDFSVQDTTAHEEIVGDKSNESFRISTFLRFPPDSPANIRHLARVGFYYTGHAYTVKCYKCDFVKENWNVGDCVTSPRWHSRDCDFSIRREHQSETKAFHTLVCIAESDIPASSHYGPIL